MNHPEKNKTLTKWFYSTEDKHVSSRMLASVHIVSGSALRLCDQYTVCAGLSFHEVTFNVMGQINHTFFLDCKFVRCTFGFSDEYQIQTLVFDSCRTVGINPLNFHLEGKRKGAGRFLPEALTTLERLNTPNVKYTKLRDHTGGDREEYIQFLKRVGTGRFKHDKFYPHIIDYINGDLKSLTPQPLDIWSVGL